MSFSLVHQRTRIHVLQAAGVLIAAAILTQHCHGPIHEFVELTGIGLVVLCIAGRVWSSLDIGSKKNRELVTAVPYSITRNSICFRPSAPWALG